MAMWQIYGASGCGIAVRSSVDRYKQSAKFNVPESQYAFGDVRYFRDITSSPAFRHDFSRGRIPAAGPAMWKQVLPICFHKRICFEYEKEWRAALYQDDRPEVDGCLIDFDLEQLVSEVYLGPRANEFLADAVSALMERFDLRRPLVRSDLLRSPTRSNISADD